MPSRKTTGVTEFGDFQTPLALARRVCDVLARRKPRPETILEPTCGQGSFLRAAMETFPQAAKVVGLEINQAHVATASRMLRSFPNGEKAQVIQADFFSTDWPALIERFPRPILVIGNPPWVTNAQLGSIGGGNLPEKTNFQKHTGLEAITGKANFDISEWMLIKLLDWLQGGRATLAVLCKTAVARKVLTHAGKNGASLRGSEIHGIDAGEHFGASVDACLLICDLVPGQNNPDCDVYRRLGDVRKSHGIGYRDGRLLANVACHQRLAHLRGQERYRWRSGVKHDCSRVMELRKEGPIHVNGLGRRVKLEDHYLYPMLKSSDVANGKTHAPSRWMLVTQRSVGENTSTIQAKAPRTWNYLLEHGEQLDRRASSVYRSRPRFSIFGVGDYSFSPYKVAISGFYKKLRFAVVGSHQGKPVVLDDTVYFVSCQSKSEAEYIAGLLNSDLAREFYSALVFWDHKRPITVDILRRLDLLALAKELGSADVLAEFIRGRSGCA